MRPADLASFLSQSPDIGQSNAFSGGEAPAQPSSCLLEAYLEHRAMLIRHFRARTGSVGLAEDIVQDLYIKLARTAPQTSVINATGFLFRAANNIWLNRLRAEHRERRRNGLWWSQSMGTQRFRDEPDAERRVIARQNLAVLMSRAGRLPPRTRQIFALHRIEGLSQVQVANRLGLSKSTIEKHLRMALEALA